MGRTLWIAAITATCALPVVAGEPLTPAAGSFHSESDWFLPYEPTRLGWTNDDDDSGFIDVSISLKYPLRSVARSLNAQDAVGTRPEECVEVLRESYLQLVYAHESNGQSISEPEQYAAAALAAARRGDDPYVVNDSLSRGWDYVGLTWKPPCAFCENDQRLWSNYFTLRYFLDDGLLQGPAEEFHDWEPLAAQGKPRSQVNGLSVLSKLQFHTCMDEDGRACRRWLGDAKLVVGYETGHEKPFRHNTFRLEAGAHLWGLPVTVWWQDGYANDLALYYVRGSTFGIGLDIGSF